MTDGALQGLAAMPFCRAREAGLDLCKSMSDSQLKQFWSVPLSYVRRMRYLLGIEKDRKGTIYIRDGHPDKWPPAFRKENLSGNEDRHAMTQPDAGTIILQAAEQDSVYINESAYTPIGQDRDALKGFALSFNGIFCAEDLKSRIDAVKALLGGSPDSRYAINVSLKAIGNSSKTSHKHPEALSG